MIRRFLAHLMLFALLSAQASALACPRTHHPVQSSHESHGDHQDSSHEGTVPEHCMMLTSCGVITPAASVVHAMHPATSLMAPLVLAAAQYSAPILAQLTPPPRSV